MAAATWLGVAKEGDMSSVDVFVPCYNYGRYLPDCVASVLAQEGVDIRILIIDDASTDGSAEVARQLAETDRRITLALHHTNQGHIATYNEGIAWAAADYMLLLSADDMVAPGAFGRAVDVMDRRATVGMVYGRACKFSTITEIPPWELQSEGDTESGHYWQIIPCRSVCQADQSGGDGHRDRQDASSEGSRRISTRVASCRRSRDVAALRSRRRRGEY